MAREAGRDADEAAEFGARVRTRYIMAAEECAELEEFEKMALSFEDRDTGLSVELLALASEEDGAAAA